MADSIDYPMGNQYAFGIDENTALVVTGSWPGGRMGEVIGENGVILFDMTSATVTGINNSSTPWAISDLRVTHMTRKDIINLHTYKVTPASFKMSLKASFFIQKLTLPIANNYF
jgi:cyanophycinase-like exopeptidase